MKKLITIQKSDDAADFADLPKIDEYINFKKTIIESGKVTYWDRTEFIDNKSVITIECDSEETFDEIVEFGKSLGDWRPGYEVLDVETVNND